MVHKCARLVVPFVLGVALSIMASVVPLESLLQFSSACSLTRDAP